MLTADRTATIRLRGMPWLGLRDSTVPVAIYLGEPPVLVDGCDVLEVSWSWGATSGEGVTTLAAAGTGTVRLLDPDRKYGPLGTIAEIGTPVSILLAGAPAFRGRIDDTDHDLEVAQLTIVDDVAALAAVQFVETSVPAETSSQRVARILDLAAWPADRRDIQAGGVPLQAGTVAADAWSELGEVARNELGAVWLTPAGVVTWRNRASTWSPPPNVVTLTPEAVPNYWTKAGTTVNCSPENLSGDLVWTQTVNPGRGTVYGAVYAVRPGDPVTFAMRARAPGPPCTGQYLSVDYLDATGAWVAQSPALLFTPDASATWRTQAKSVAIPDGVWFVQPRVDLDVGGAALTWSNFDTVTLTLPGEPLVNLGCPPSIAYLTDLDLRADQGALVNSLAAARRTGTQRVVTDPASIAKYRLHSHVQNDLELATDGDRDLWQSFYLTRSRNPAKGVGSIATRPGASAIATLLGLPFGGIVHIADQGHGPDIDTRARWLGTRWLAGPDYVECSAVLGMDQTIAPVARVLAIDTGPQFLAVQATPAPTNVTAREPGLQLTTIPRRPPSLAVLLRDAIADRDRPTPTDDD